jgi:hypothetical protein
MSRVASYLARLYNYLEMSANEIVRARPELGWYRFGLAEDLSFNAFGSQD